ncbi:MAG: sulfoxide reductase heme-binding subunit YedZ [Acidobacteria bacterium]|nr:sulfoxide reductase heme-binding subunit YedZ [Acidobacteriota bacterium]
MKRLVFLASLLPLAWLLGEGFTGKLGPNPVEAITHSTGDWALRFLLATLVISPARRVLKQPSLIGYRRLLGLYAFFYAALHLLTWVWLDKFFDWPEMWDDLLHRRFIMAGLLALALMVPLALTSTTASIARLGGRNWRRLHQAVYVVAIAALVHYYWLVKSDITAPLSYGAVLGVLLLFRVVVKLLVSRRPDLPARQGS